MPFVGIGVGVGRQRFRGGFVGLLDEYSGAAAAYSLRQLRGSYTGDAIRVRRASDNDELEIAFVNNVLDTASLTTFCSGTDGFVTTWYDQSGNGRDATQGTAAQQPKIYDSVSGVIEENGKPAIQFDGSNDYLNADNVGSYNSHTGILIFKRNLGYIWGISYNDSNSIFCWDNNIRYWCRSTAAQVNPNALPPITDQNLTFLQRDNLNMSSFLNGNLRGTFTDTVTFGNINLDMQIGWAIPRSNASEYFDGTFQEIIYYPTYEGSNRINIETNINDFYSIYP